MKKVLSLMGPWRAIFFPAAIWAGIILSFVVVVAPLIQKLMVDQKALSVQQSKLDFLSGKILKLKGLDGEIVRERLALIDSAIPSQKDALLGFVYIQKLAQEHQVSLDSLAVSPGLVSTGSAATSSEGTDRGLAFQVGASGEAGAIAAFIGSFSRPSFPIFVPRSVTLSYGGEQVTAVMVLSMMWMAPPAVFGGAGKPVAVLTSDQESFLEWLGKFDKRPEGASVILPAGGGAVVRTTLF